MREGYRAGRRNQRITFQRVTGETRTPSGAVVPTWSDVVSLWADVDELNGNELWRAQQVQSKVTHFVTILYYAGLTTAHRIVWEARTLGIDGIANPDGVKRQLELRCAEQLGQTASRDY